MLTNCRTLPGQALLAKPWKMAAHMRYASKPKWFNRLATNVRDGLVNGIRRENEVQVGRADLPTLRHLFDEADQLAPIISPHNHNWKILDFPILNERERLE